MRSPVLRSPGANANTFPTQGPIATQPTDASPLGQQGHKLRKHLHGPQVYMCIFSPRLLLNGPPKVEAKPIDFHLDLQNGPATSAWVPGLYFPLAPWKVLDHVWSQIVPLVLRLFCFSIEKVEGVGVERNSHIGPRVILGLYIAYLYAFYIHFLILSSQQPSK